MGKFSDYIGSQFGNPHGIVGFICCILMNLINRRMYKKTVSLLELSKDQKLLDIGYGNGYLLKELDRHFKCHLYGIDISEDMKRLATKNNPKSAAENRLNLELGDCCHLQYQDGFFDAVTSINTVYFWNDTVKGLSEIRRCLKKNGKFINVVYTKDWLDSLKYTEKGFKKFEPAELVELGRQAGFEDIETIQIVKGKSYAVIYNFR